MLSIAGQHTLQSLGYQYLFVCNSCCRLAKCLPFGPSLQCVNCNSFHTSINPQRPTKAKVRQQKQDSKATTEFDTSVITANTNVTTTDANVSPPTTAPPTH